jgi:hypothetical protein
VADALEYLLDILHEAIVEDGLVEFDMAEVTLTLSGLSAGLTLLIQSGDSEPEIVGSSSNWLHTLIEPRLGDLRNGP